MDTQLEYLPIDRLKASYEQFQRAHEGVLYALHQRGLVSLRDRIAENKYSLSARRRRRRVAWTLRCLLVVGDGTALFVAWTLKEQANPVVMGCLLGVNLAAVLLIPHRDTTSPISTPFLLQELEDLRQQRTVEEELLSSSRNGRMPEENSVVNDPVCEYRAKLYIIATALNDVIRVWNERAKQRGDALLSPARTRELDLLRGWRSHLADEVERAVSCAFPVPSMFRNIAGCSSVGEILTHLEQVTISVSAPSSPFNPPVTSA